MAKSKRVMGFIAGLLAIALGGLECEGIASALVFTTTAVTAVNSSHDGMPASDFNWYD